MSGLTLKLLIYLSIDNATHSFKDYEQTLRRKYFLWVMIPIQGGFSCNEIFNVHNVLVSITLNAHRTDDSMSFLKDGTLVQSFSRIKDCIGQINTPGT